MPQEDSRRALSLLDRPIDWESDALGQRLDTNAAALPYSRSRSIRRSLDSRTSKSTIIAVYCVRSVLDFESNLKSLNVLTWVRDHWELKQQWSLGQKALTVYTELSGMGIRQISISSVLISCHFEFSCKSWSRSLSTWLHACTSSSLFISIWNSFSKKVATGGTHWRAFLQLVDTTVGRRGQEKKVHRSAILAVLLVQIFRCLQIDS